MSTKDGGPAFPVADIYHPNGQIQYGTSGMTLRDYFAAAALQGLLSFPDPAYIHNGAREVSLHKDEFISIWAYNLADAMLRAREAAHD